MLREFQQRLRLNHESEGYMYDAGDNVQPIGDRGLPSSLRHACYNPRVRRLFFTVPEAPNELKVSALADKGGASFLPYLESHPQPGEIMAICSRDEFLFVLLLVRGRRPEEHSWTLSRIRLEPWHRLQSATVDGPLRVDFTSSPPGRLRLSMNVAPRAKHLYDVFLSGSDGTLHTPFALQRPMAFGPCSWSGGTGDCQIVAGTDFENRDDELWVLHAKARKLSRVKIQSAIPSPSAVLTFPEGVAFSEEDTMAAFQFRSTFLKVAKDGTEAPSVRLQTTSEDKLERDFTIQYLIVTSAATCRVWCVFKGAEGYESAPLIGGGTQSPSFGVPRDLLKLDIGPVDTVVPIHDRGLLLGERDSDKWYSVDVPGASSQKGKTDPYYDS